MTATSPFKQSLLSVMLIGLLSGCGGTNSTDETTGEVSPEQNTPPQRKALLAFVTNMAADFWVYAEAGVNKAVAEHDDIEVQFMIGDGTPIKQRQLIDNLLVKGAEGIAISPTSPKAQTVMINGWAAKVPIICQDSDAPDSDRITYLGTDNVAAGRQCGELVKRALPNGGSIMVFVGLADQLNSMERYAGLKEALKGSHVTVLGLRTDGGDFTKARSVAATTLTKYPDIAGMVGLWSYNAPLILEAVRSQNKLGKVQIIAFDEDERTLRAIDDGHIYGTVVQNPFEFGYQCITILRALVVEKKSPADAGIPENKKIIIPAKVLVKGQGLAYAAYLKSLMPDKG